MKEDRDIYLGHTTGVNVYIGVKYYRYEREDSFDLLDSDESDFG